MATKLTKRNLNLFTKKNLLPKEVEQFKGEDKSWNNEQGKKLLEQCRKMFDAMQNFRSTRLRNLNYTYGRQWEDLIEDPDNHWGRRKITEREYILRQGKVPLKNNIITKLMNSMVGLYRSQKSEPLAISRDRDEQKLGEMMSIALQYAYQSNKIHEMNATAFKEALISGMAIRKIGYDWDDERHLTDVTIQNINPSCVFMNTDISDVRMKDLKVFGVLHDMDLVDIIRLFAKTKTDSDKIVECYRNVNRYLESTIDAFDGQRFNEMEFYQPYDTTKCRVIEVWKKENKERIRWHDTQEAETGVADINELYDIIEENKRRVAEITSLGGKEEDAALINYEWFIDSFWYVRYLTPNGVCIFEEETPYTHNSLPYVVRAYPLVNGEIHSFIESVIDQQRYINRYITMMDFARGAGAKGVLIFPKELIPDGMTEEDICDQWVKYNGVIFAQMKKGYENLVPHQFNTSAVQASDIQMLELQMKLVDEISGIHGALQGKTANSGTPASLYAQEAQNASINVLDFFDWYKMFTEDCDYKLMKTIQQYYNEPRYINIAGSDFHEEARWYNPERIKNSEFDISIMEATSTPAYRMYQNEILMNALQSGFIDFKQYLESSNLPFSDKLLESIKRKESDVEYQQQGMQGAMPQGGEGITKEQAQQLQDAAVAQGLPEEGVPQGVDLKKTLEVQKAQGV